MSQNDYFKDLTWTCHICKEERPDDKISVRTSPLLTADGKEIGSQNIRYCNDKIDCIEKSKTFKFI